MFSQDNFERSAVQCSYQPHKKSAFRFTLYRNYLRLYRNYLPIRLVAIINVDFMQEFLLLSSRN